MQNEAFMNDPKILILIIWDGLVHQGLLTYQDRIIVPQSCHSDIPLQLHASHQGIVKTHKAAQQLYFWPGVFNDIHLMVEACHKCQSI